MSNPNIVRVLQESVDEHRSEELKKQKLILIEDIFKIRKRLYALGRFEYTEHLSSEKSGVLFNYLYDKSINQLNVLLKMYTFEISTIKVITLYRP